MQAEVFYMSITAKQFLIKNVAASLAEDLTAKDLDRVRDVLNETLALFEVETAQAGKADAETDDLLGAFLDAKRIEGRSEKTLRLYDYRIRQLIDAVDVPIRHVTVFHLRKILMEQKQRGIADRTLAGMRSIYCSFFGWLYNEGLLPANPCANLAPIKVPKVVRLPYTDVELERLREACTSPRDKAIIAFLLSTGCRVSEMCELDKDDVDFSRGEAVVLGKGAKERTVFLGDVAMMHLRRYLMERKDDSPALFASRCSDRLTPNGVRKMLHAAAVRAGVEDVHPHRFRRTLATTLIDHGMPIQEVATVLGHDKLDTTMCYVYQCKEDIHNNYRKYA